MDVSKILEQDIQEKKKAGRGAFARKATRRGSVGALRTPYNMASPKEKKQYLKSEMRVFNLNDIVSYKEFKTYDDEKKKLLLTHWRDNYPNKKIADEMGTSVANLSYFVTKLGLQNKSYSNTRKTYNQEKFDKETELILEELPLDYEQFKLRSKEEKVAILLDLRERYSNRVLAEYWGVPDKTVSKIVYKLLGKVRKKKEEQLEVEQPKEEVMEVTTETAEEVVEVETIIPPQNLVLDMNCMVTKETFLGVFKNLNQLLTEGKEYEINIVIK